MSVGSGSMRPAPLERKGTFDAEDLVYATKHLGLASSSVRSMTGSQRALPPRPQSLDVDDPEVLSLDDYLLELVEYYDLDPTQVRGDDVHLLVPTEKLADVKRRHQEQLEEVHFELSEVERRLTSERRSNKVLQLKLEEHADGQVEANGQHQQQQQQNAEERRILELEVVRLRRALKQIREREEAARIERSQMFDDKRWMSDTKKLSWVIDELFAARQQAIDARERNDRMRSQLQHLAQSKRNLELELDAYRRGAESPSYGSAAPTDLPALSAREERRRVRESLSPSPQATHSRRSIGSIGSPAPSYTSHGSSSYRALSPSAMAAAAPHAVSPNQSSYWSPPPTAVAMMHPSTPEGMPVANSVFTP